jgi:hypothetical protein
MSSKLPTQTYHDIEKEKVDFEYLRNKLKLKQLQARATFSKKYPHVEKFLAEKGVEVGKLREHSAKIVGAGALTGTLLLAPPTGTKALPSTQEILAHIREERPQEAAIPKKVLVDGLKKLIPQKPRPLTREEEKALEGVFKEVVGVSAKATLEGEHLNTTYGYIGAEQHLKRYPGDNIQNHKPFLKEGIAPGLGAWGYFAPSKDKMNSQLEETEKWYAVVQTLYLPDWAKRQPYLRDWYKYRKVLIVNTTNGNAVVAGIADSGPAAWTGKHFGGSPEVMEYLGGPRYKKGPVVLFFVDDPENKVPLGPVDYNEIKLPILALRSI